MVDSFLSTKISGKLNFWAGPLFYLQQKSILYFRSLSFILSMSSMAFTLLTLMFILIDVLEVWSGKPFLYVGMNPILVSFLVFLSPQFCLLYLLKAYFYSQVYLGHEICHGMIPFGWTPISSSHYELLTMNLWGAYLWVFIAFQLFKRKIFFSV